MKVEQALRVLPALGAMAPLRSLVLSSAEPSEGTVWGSARPYLTVGKHDVRPAELRRRLAPAFAAITAHLAELYGAFIDAVESIDRGDVEAAVRRFVDAGRREREVGRGEEARVWFETALELAEPLQDRRAEVEVLLALGQLTLAAGSYEKASRWYQRALAVADAAMDLEGALAASEGLGTVSVETDEWDGAHAWYTRALGTAEASGQRSRVARIRHTIAEFLRRKGELDAAAAELKQARQIFEEENDAHSLARVLCTQGLLAGDQDMPEQAAGAFREALAWLRGGEAQPGLELFIRLSFARLCADQKQFRRAEDQIRRAEQLALATNRIARLIQLYVLLGTIRGRQSDEGGFVLFEHALLLTQLMQPSPVLEGEVYRAYGEFMRHMGRPEEAWSYLGRARDLFAVVGAQAALREVESELNQLTP
ncbi:MAG TPA: tetratricopeptide repeat protein [Gemmatimonadaceae bacterium]